ncbi:MAG: hypothetical protein HY744_05390 [Deltaproteobacteria bacterium]|nr:hypothetical protein [Deltaproteobacteria bacterium]
MAEAKDKDKDEERAQDKQEKKAPAKPCEQKAKPPDYRLLGLVAVVAIGFFATQWLTMDAVMDRVDAMESHLTEQLLNLERQLGAAAQARPKAERPAAAAPAATAVPAAAADSAAPAASAAPAPAASK